MRVLVTGASGLLGRTVAQRLIATGHHVTVLQRRSSGLDCDEILGDIRDDEAVQAAMAGQEAVVHLAARVSPTGSWQEFFDVNVIATQHLVDASKKAGATRFVYVSTPAVASSGVAHIGVNALPADPTTTRTHYARSKAEAERFVLGVNELAVTAVRPHLVWGPGDEQLVARIVGRAASGMLRSIGSGAALVDSTYVDNAADAIVAAFERTEIVHGKALVISNGEPRPVAELIGGICRAAGVQVPPGAIPPLAAKVVGSAVDAVWAVARIDRDPPMTRFLAEQLSTAHWYDQRETHNLLDWAPAVSIDEGFARVSAWFQKHPL